MSDEYQFECWFGYPKLRHPYIVVAIVVGTSAQVGALNSSLLRSQRVKGQAVALAPYACLVKHEVVVVDEAVVVAVVLF